MSPQDLLSLVAIGIGTFVATDLDDVLILFALFLDKSLEPRLVVAGQYLGIAVLVLISFAGSMSAIFIPREAIGFLGLVPLGLGILRLMRRLKGEAAEEDDDVPVEGLHGARSWGKVLGVAGITIGSGGDNIGTYVPLFAGHPGIGALILATTFMTMTGVWCALAYWMSRHPLLRGRVTWISGTVLPFVLIAVGLAILLEAGSLSFLFHSAG